MARPHVPMKATRGTNGHHADHGNVVHIPRESPSTRWPHVRSDSSPLSIFGLACDTTVHTVTPTGATAGDHPTIPLSLHERLGTFSRVPTLGYRCAPEFTGECGVAAPLPMKCLHADSRKEER